MRGPILGIAAVFFLQLGVIGYGTVTRFFEAPAEVNSIATNAEPLPTISDSEFFEFEPETGVEADIIATNAVRPVYVSSRRVRQETPKRSGFRTFDTQFKPVTINVPKPSPYTFAAYEPQLQRTEYPLTQASDRGPVNYEVSAKTVDVRNRRGFFAKTLTVIKKPYDWMKAVGSKLK
jgi:hypothetical protein